MTLRTHKTTHPGKNRSKDMWHNWSKHGIGDNKAPEGESKVYKEPEEMASRFEVIAHARNTLHQQVMEALYIRSPFLCRQKEHVSVIHLL